MLLRDAALDLLLGSACVGCLRPGRLVCEDCAAGLPAEAVPARPDPCPPGLVTAWAAGPYDGLLRALVLGHKERGLHGLRPTLAGLLTVALRAVLETGSPAVGSARERAPLVLVPVPSRSATLRARGHDPTWTMTRTAARLLAGAGADVTAVRLLGLRTGVQDQSGLDAGARAANLDGSMSCPSSGLLRLSRRRPWARVVVCDDVVTTGATLREAQRALEAVGLPVVGAAAVAATRRRSPPRSGRAAR